RRLDRLRTAERKLRTALDLAPNTLEARLRFGRVLQELGALEDARRALVGLPTSSDPRVRYLSSLFMGELADVQGDTDGARQWYDRALDVVPGQSAIVARSELLHRTGDVDAAAAVLRAALQSPNREDPWWTYALGQYWMLDTSIAQLRGLT